jgi:hypothetical protein
MTVAAIPIIDVVLLTRTDSVMIMVVVALVVFTRVATIIIAVAIIAMALGVRLPARPWRWVGLGNRAAQTQTQKPGHSGHNNPDFHTHVFTPDVGDDP